MEITFLGTASAYPSPHRGTTAYILKMQLLGDNELLLFDAGEGTQIQLMKSRCKMSKITRIFITHLHGDHIFGLTGLLCTISMQMQVEDTTKIIEIYGPTGIRKFLRTNLLISRSDLCFRIRIHEIQLCNEQCEDLEKIDDISTDLLSFELQGNDISQNENQFWQICEGKQFKVIAKWIKHRIPCFGYVIIENDRPGKLDAEKLKILGVKPGPIYQQIKNGNTIILENGNEINAMDVISAKVKGRKIAILGDTCDALSSMVDICESCDLIIHEATLENEMHEKAILNGHSTPEMAGIFARTCNAKQLVLTHFSQRYRPISENENSKDVEKMVQQAKNAFQSDNVIAALDLMYFEIGEIINYHH